MYTDISWASETKTYRINIVQRMQLNQPHQKGPVPCGWKDVQMGNESVGGMTSAV